MTIKRKTRASYVAAASVFAAQASISLAANPGFACPMPKPLGECEASVVLNGMIMQGVQSCNPALANRSATIEAKREAMACGMTEPLLSDLFTWGRACLSWDIANIGVKTACSRLDAAMTRLEQKGHR